jgi:hypothetical protein
MTEVEWAETIKDLINNFLPKPTFSATTGTGLIYANEIISYSTDEHGNKPKYNTMAYETDILIQENISATEWMPRVVIETKIDAVSTHDAITYSNKSKAHKSVHPYLRYGIFIGNHSNKHIPGRLIRHGEDFDFMMSCADYKLNETEFKTFKEIVNLEILASQTLTSLVFNTRAKDKQRIFALHRPLVTKNV